MYTMYTMYTMVLIAAMISSTESLTESLTESASIGWLFGDWGTTCNEACAVDSIARGKNSTCQAPRMSAVVEPHHFNVANAGIKASRGEAAGVICIGGPVRSYTSGYAPVFEESPYGENGGECATDFQSPSGSLCASELWCCGKRKRLCCCTAPDEDPTAMCPVESAAAQHGSNESDADADAAAIVFSILGALTAVVAIIGIAIGVVIIITIRRRTTAMKSSHADVHVVPVVQGTVMQDTGSNAVEAEATEAEAEATEAEATEAEAAARKQHGAPPLPPSHVQHVPQVPHVLHSQQRLADDGHPYTKDEFMEHYVGTDEWLVAQPYEG